MSEVSCITPKMSSMNGATRNSYQPFSADNMGGACGWNSTEEPPSSFSTNNQQQSSKHTTSDDLLVRPTEAAAAENASCHSSIAYKTDTNLGNEDEDVGRERSTVLSTEGVVRVAAAHIIRLSDLVSNRHSEQATPLELLHLNLAGDDVRDVELASHLIDAAEKVSNRQLDRASSLLRQCFLLSSPAGNPVERVVYHFSKGLEERIFRETGNGTSEASKETEITAANDVINATLGNHAVHLVAYRAIPFHQLFHSLSVQAFLDNMASARRIHIIDFAIRHGLQWRILMQALAARDACPVESLKISAVGSSVGAISAVGESLSSLAERLRLPFEFREVVLQDLRDLREDMFDLDEGEALGISSHLVLNTLIVKPENVEKVMRVVRSLRPCVMVVMDVEANLNSPSFISRFTEALFFFSAYFDCLHATMKTSGESRRMIEEGFFSQIIKTVVATEGSERVMRRVGVQVWRSFFTRFGLKETELSERSKKQARYIIKKSFKDGSCMLERNGKALLIEWKGTPLHFISAWKFQH
ncbi:scarecrow-like protein 18 [Iris pallida]|uniref:Scarecrow-like protein 18 n=1 Tax=Iris pallida TaxID=29817 RepID=A0AAX6EXQ1_IRIPA|nr:scarecrow-like protein 18 [Iris pallida]